MITEALTNMNEKDVWPPPPGPQDNANQSSEAVEIAVCPTCQRKLLTQTSPLCNWCGAQIDNPEYQARAAQSRQERDQAERDELESIIQEEAQHGILGRLKRLGKQNKIAPRKDPLV